MKPIDRLTVWETHMLAKQIADESIARQKSETLGVESLDPRYFRGASDRTPRNWHETRIGREETHRDMIRGTTRSALTDRERDALDAREAVTPANAAIFVYGMASLALTMAMLVVTVVQWHEGSPLTVIVLLRVLAGM